MTIGLYYDWWAMGPGEVFKYVLMGFDELGVKYELNTTGDINWFIQRNRALDTEPLESFPNLFIGPNIVDIPPYCQAMLNHDRYVTTIVPSPWVKSIHSKWLPQDKITVWNAGIDYNRWSEKKADIEFDFLIYFKSRSQEDLEFAKDFLSKRGLRHIVMEYGKFNHDTFYEAISKSKYGLLIDNSETQGIAIAEMMSCNLPLLVWDIQPNGSDFPPTSVPYFNETCGEIFYDRESIEASYEKLVSSEYSPREYILENCNYITQAKKILEILGYYKTSDNVSIA